MSYLFSGESARSRQDTLNNLSTASFTEEDQEAPIFTPENYVEGITAGPRIAANAAAGMAIPLSKLASGVTKALDVQFGTNTDDWWHKHVTQSLINTSDNLLTPDPKTTHMALQIADQFATTAAKYVAVGGNPYLFGTFTGAERAVREAEKGKSADTALQMGAIEGVTNLLGAKLPPAFASNKINLPQTVLNLPTGIKSALTVPVKVQGAVTGAAINAAIGIPARVATANALELGGYPEEAKQSTWNDPVGLGVDVGLGMLFGAAHQHMLPSHMDAILTANDARAIETPQGIRATNPAANNSLVDNMNAAVHALVNDEPVSAALTAKQRYDAQNIWHKTKPADPNAPVPEKTGTDINPDPLQPGTTTQETSATNPDGFIFEPWSEPLDEQVQTHITDTYNEAHVKAVDSFINDNPELINGIIDKNYKVALTGIAEQAGWDTTGGQILRDDQGNVVGRTPWLPKQEWFGRFIKEGIGNKKDLEKAVTRFNEGKPLGPTQTKIIDWLKQEVDGNNLDQQGNTFSASNRREDLRTQILDKMQVQEEQRAKQVEDHKANLSGQNVYDAVLGQLQETGRFDMFKDEGFAKFMQHTAVTQAKRLGMTPDDYYKEYGAKIVGKMATDRQMENAGLPLPKDGVLSVPLPEKYKSDINEKTVKSLLPFNIQGNKSHLLANSIGKLMESSARASKRVIDAFGGSGGYTHYLSHVGALPEGSILNEYDPMRVIAHKQMRDNPEEVIKYAQEFEDYVATQLKKIDQSHNNNDVAKAVRSNLTDWAREQLKAHAIPGQDYVAKGKSSTPIEMQDTPRTAGLYYLLQSQAFNFIPIQADTSKTGNFRVPGFAFVGIDNKTGKVKKFARGKIYLDNKQAIISSTAQRTKNVDVRRGDGWALIKNEAGEGDLVTVDTSYLNKGKVATTNYSKATEEDANPETYVQKVIENLLPAWERGAKLVITNNWNDDVARILKSLGFEVYKTQRSDALGTGENNEIVALNYDPETNRVIARRTNMDGELAGRAADYFEQRRNSNTDPDGQQRMARGTDQESGSVYRPGGLDDYYKEYGAKIVGKMATDRQTEAFWQPLPEVKNYLPEGQTHIDIDGIQKPALNSNGKPIHPTIEGVQNFWKWFDNSKVVDEEGRPLVVYHGVQNTYTSKLIVNPKLESFSKRMMDKYKKWDTRLFSDTERKEMLSYENILEHDNLGSDLVNGLFDVSLSGDIGIHFGDVITANEFSKNNGAIYPVYLKIEKLVNVPDIFSRYGEYIKTINTLNERELLSSNNYKILLNQAINLESIEDRIADQRDIGQSKEYKSFWKKTRNSINKKADGFIYKNEIEGNNETNYVVFNPNQIKSATGNTGAFDPNNPNILHQFAGDQARTADIFQLEIAKQRLDKGEDPETIRQETGWFKGADGKMRFEIDDSQASLKKPFPEKGQLWGDIYNSRFEKEIEGGVQRLTLGDILDHPRLYEAYPSLKNLTVASKPGKGASLAAKSEPMHIVIGEEMRMSEVKSILLHEIQHGIQTIEGFASGGSATRMGMADFSEPYKQQLEDLRLKADEALAAGDVALSDRLHMQRAQLYYPAQYEAYKRLYGEVEARNTSGRGGLSAEDRIILPPESTQDTYNADVVVVFNGKDMANAPAPENAKPKAAMQQESKGAYHPDSRTISLFNSADASTFLHESGHYFLDLYTDMIKSGVSDGIIDADMNTLLNWFGVDDFQTWTRMSTDEQRPYHEQFAKGFETYLSEGTAPTPELLSLFQSFAKWLKEVYGDVQKALGVNLTDEVRGVMDRIIADGQSKPQAGDTPEITAARQLLPSIDEARQFEITDAQGNVIDTGTAAELMARADAEALFAEQSDIATQAAITCSLKWGDS